MNAPHAVIWDVDGTLVDTAELHFQAWVEVARELAKPFTRADFAATFGRRNPEIIRELFGTHYSDQDIDELGRHKELLYRAAARKLGVELLPGVSPLLEALRQAEFRQAVGSSAPRENLDLILTLTAIAPFFAAIVAMEDTQRGKPDPQVFQVAAARVEVPPERCVVVEDAPAGVQAARAGGMRCIAVSFVGHHDEATLRNAGAHLIVHSLKEVDVAAVRKLLL